jgi:hypothetical protein
LCSNPSLSQDEINMQIRGNSYSIKELLVTSDFNFSYLGEEEKNEVAAYCYEHINEFKECIELLIGSYENINIHSKAREIENEIALIDDVEKIQTCLQEIQEYLKNIESQLENFKQSSYAGNIYHSFLKESTKTLSLQNEKMKELTSNMGLEKIQTTLLFCSQLILHHHYFPSDSRKENDDYCEIAKLLAEFWYNEGKSLAIKYSINHNDYTNNNSAIQIHILISLMLFIMAGSTKASLLENACYIHILKNTLDIDIEKQIPCHYFELETFAQQHPEDYLKLYHHLVSENPVITHFMESHAFTSNLYVNFKLALFDLYAGMTNSENNLDHYKSAKEKLLHCIHNHKNTSAAEILEKYYPKLDLETEVELAIFYFNLANKEKSLQFSEIIYQKLNSNLEEILQTKIDSLLTLFHYWLSSHNSNFKEIALKVVSSYAASNDRFAKEILLAAAKNDLDCALSYSHIILTANKHNKSHKAYEILLPYRESKNSRVFFNLYLLSKLNNESNYEWLVQAAELGSEDAKNEIGRLIKNSDLDSNPYATLQKLLVNVLTKNHSLTIYKLLCDFFRDTKTALQIASFSLEHPKQIEPHEWINTICESIEPKKISLLEEKYVDLFLRFYECLLKHSQDGKKIHLALEKLKQHTESKNMIAYQMLLPYAKYQLEIALHLTKFSLHDYVNSSDMDKKNSLKLHLNTLLDALRAGHSNNDSGEKHYHIYFIKKILSKNKDVDLDLLKLSYINNYPAAIDEFLSLAKELLADFNKIKRDLPELSKKANEYILFGKSILASLGDKLSSLDDRLSSLGDGLSSLDDSLTSHNNSHNTSHNNSSTNLNDNLTILKDSNHVFHYDLTKTLALLYLKLKDYPKAEEYLRTCLKVKPEDILSEILSFNQKHKFSKLFQEFYLEIKMKIIRQKNEKSELESKLKSQLESESESPSNLTYGFAKSKIFLFNNINEDSALKSIKKEKEELIDEINAANLSVKANRELLASIHESKNQGDLQKIREQLNKLCGLSPSSGQYIKLS